LFDWGCCVKLEVEALPGWIVVVSVGVRVTKAIVTRLEESHEGLWVTKAREVSVTPCILTRGDFLRIGGCGWVAMRLKVDLRWCPGRSTYALNEVLTEEA
jgi:hypothetical protein